MKVLLDTCALLDLIIDPDQIKPSVRNDLAQVSTEVLVSAASAWEVAIKTRQGRLPGGQRLIDSWDQTLLELQAEPLAIDAEDTLRAGGLSWKHRDPFDRMLAAQSARQNIPLVTSDKLILKAGVVAVISTR